MSIIIDGTGTISGVSSTGLTTAQTVTASAISSGAVTQSTIATGVAGTGPALAAYVNAGTTSISATTWTNVPLDTKEFDTASRYNNTGSTVGGIPAYSFLPNVAGYYQVSWGVTINSSGSNTFRTMLNKNGSFYRYGNYISTSTSIETQAVSVGSSLVYLNGTTDYITLQAFSDIGTSAIYGGSPYNSYITATMTRAA